MTGRIQKLSSVRRLRATAAGCIHKVRRHNIGNPGNCAADPDVLGLSSDMGWLSSDIGPVSLPLSLSRYPCYLSCEIATCSLSSKIDSKKGSDAQDAADHNDSCHFTMTGGV